jgi:hypothetical protein
MGWFDTAELYSAGRSEVALGEAARADGRPVLVASKFAPFPYRVTAAQFASALDKTLERLGRDFLDLYYLHFPYSARGVGAWMRAMARAVKAGKIRAVGPHNDAQHWRYRLPPSGRSAGRGRIRGGGTGDIPPRSENRPAAWILPARAAGLHEVRRFCAPTPPASGS